jgi:ABC-type branched-subunit amino acid transport system substrate-binding protein
LKFRISSFKWRPRLVVLPLTALVVLAGCGFGGGSSGSGPKVSAGSGPIHFAVLASFTGAFADIGAAMWEGAKAGEAAVNDSGGINGRKLVVDLVDTVGDPADAVPALNKEIITNHPIGAIGPTTSEIFGLQPILDRNKLPFMFEGGSTVFDTNKDPYLWRSNPSDGVLGVCMATWAIQHGYKTAAFTFSTAESVQTLGKVVEDAYKKLGGTITVSVPLTPQQPSYRSEILRVVQSKPQAVLMQTEAVSAGAYFNDFRELGGLNIPFIGSDITTGSDFIKAVTPDFMNKHVVSCVGSSQPGPGGDAFNKFYAKAFTHQPLGSANYAYDGTVDLALAIAKSDSANSSAINTAIRQLSNPPGTECVNYADCLKLVKDGKDATYRGASGPLQYDKYQNVFGPFDVVQAQADGTLKTLVTYSADELTKAAGGTAPPLKP